MRRHPAAIAVTTVLIVAACGGQTQTTRDETIDPKWTRMPEVSSLSEFPVEPSLTETRAQDLAIQHLTEAIAAAPQELSLIYSDQWNGKTLNKRFVSSCIFGSEDANDPVRLLMSYLVVGQTRPPFDYLDDIAQAWATLGWEISTHPANPGVVRATTADHFTITANGAEVGDTEFAVVTPCFPSSGRGGAPLLPSTIPHP